MDLRHYRYVVSLAEELHFGRAAAKLGLSQPALSIQIRDLEEELGTPLFWRSKREVRLTAAGNTLLAHARDILGRVEHSRSETRSVGRGDLGSLEIGYMSSLSARIVPRAVRAFRRRYPKVEVKLRLLIPPAHRLQIATGQVDFAFIIAPTEPEAFAVETIQTESHVAALPQGHPLASRSRVPIRALGGCPFVIFPRYAAPDLYDLMMRHMRDNGARPNVVLEPIPVYGILAAIAAGVGVSLVPECLQGLRQDGVVYRPVTGPRLPITWSIAYRPGALEGARAAFLDVVRGLSAKRLWGAP